MMRKILICLLGILVFSGCQMAPEEDREVSTQKELLPTPSIKGPSSPPFVKGPSAPPPSPEAMSETETVEYSLPLSNE